MRKDELEIALLSKSEIRKRCRDLLAENKMLKRQIDLLSVRVCEQRRKKR